MYDFDHGTPENDYEETMPSVPKVTKSVALEQVRAVFADKCRNGYTAAVKEIILRHGANKLSEINPNEYAAILAEAEKLG